MIIFEPTVRSYCQLHVIWKTTGILYVIWNTNGPAYILCCYVFLPFFYVHHYKNNRRVNNVNTTTTTKRTVLFFFFLLLFFKGCEIKEIESSSRFCGCPVALLAVSSSQHHMIHVFQRVCDTSGYHRWCWPKLFNQEEKPVFLPLHLLNQ